MKQNNSDQSVDISGLLKKKEINLKHHEKDFTTPAVLPNLILSNSHIGIFILNNAFTCVYANHEMAAIVGYGIDDIIGKDFRQFIPIEDHERVTDLYLRRQRGEAPPDRYEAEFIHQDGERRTVEVSAFAVQTDDRQVVTVVQAYDITDRKRMEAEVEQSGKKYRDFFQNVLDFIFIHDLDGNLIENNIRYVTEMGGQPDIIATANLRDLMPEKYKPELDDYLKRIVKNGRDEGVIAIQIPNGEIRILEYKNLLQHDSDGMPESVMGSARDITDHITDRKALWESKERYQMIVENVEDYVYEIDHTGNYTFVNEALVRQSGYRRDELIGMNFRDYTLPEDREKTKKYHNQIFNTGKTGKGLQHSVIRKDGSILHIELVSSLIRNSSGVPVGFRGVARDVTERKLAEKILKESEQQLKEIIEGSPIPTIVFDQGYRITHWNRACEELTDIKEIDLIGKSKSTAEALLNQPILPDFLIQGASLEKMSRFYGAECRKSKIVKNAFEVECFFPQLGNKGRWMFLTLAYLRNHENNIIGVIETLLDVTSQKQAEINLLKMHDALEGKVEERTQELQKVNIALEVLLKKRENDKKKLEDKVAYSIKEILTPHLELLKKTKLDKHQKVYLEILEANFREIASPFMAMLSDNMQKLTRTEIQVINLIKQNKITKEIADLMGISTRTVETHRDNIRKKLGIKNKKINLRSYLLKSE